MTSLKRTLCESKFGGHAAVSAFMCRNRNDLVRFAKALNAAYDEAGEKKTAPKASKDGNTASKLRSSKAS